MARLLPVGLVVAVTMLAATPFARAQVTATADVYMTPRDTPISIAAPGVLANDTSDDSLAVRVVSGPRHGTVTLATNGGLEYTPATGFEGRDTLTYIAQVMTPVRFVVDSTSTSMTLNALLDIEYDSASDEVTSRVGGYVDAYLLPGSAPFIEIHVIDADLIVQEGLHLDFDLGLFGHLLADAPEHGLRVSMVEEGGAAPADGGAFRQDDNLLRLSTRVAIEGTGLLGSMVDPSEQDIVLDEQVVLAGEITTEAAGTELQLQIPVTLQGTFEMTSGTLDVELSGTVIASAPLELPTESEETMVRIDVGDVGTSREDAELPAQAVFADVYPNPFNPTAVVSYILPSAAEARLAVFDGLGREVKVLVDGVLPAGQHEVAFNAAGLPSGVYFIHLRTPGGLDVVPAVLAK